MKTVYDHTVNVTALDYHRQCKAMDQGGPLMLIDEPAPYFAKVTLAFVDAMTHEERLIALRPVSDGAS